MNVDAGLNCPIVGFEFTGDALLEGEFLPLRQGLTVLYGLNGAGKSRLLRGIQAALTGIRTEVELGMIVRVDGTAPDDDWDSRTARHRSIRTALAQAILALSIQNGRNRRGYAPEQAFAGMSPTERPMASAEADAVIGEYLQELAGNEDPDLAAELLGTRFFLLMPTGTRKHPAWDAWPVADTALPAAARVFTEMQAAADAVNASALPDGFDQFAPSYGAEFDSAFAEFEVRFGPRALVAGSASPQARGRGSVSPSRFAFFTAGTIDMLSVRGLELQGTIDLGVDLLGFDDDAEAATERYLADVTTMLTEIERFHAWKTGEETADFPAVLERSLLRATEELSRLAEAITQRAIPGAPTMRLHVRPRELMFSGPAVEWQFGAHEIALDGLSRAERLWATRAINQAIHQHIWQSPSFAGQLLGYRPDRPSIAILDEPEAALHRSAEAQMAAFLVDEHLDPHRCTITATHSPDLLDAPASHTIEVQRAANSGSGKSQVQQLAPADRTDLARLGLHPSDLLRSTRAFLLVEGVHDELALRAFLNDRLRKARVEIVTLFGSKNLKKTLENEVLYRFTGAKVVALLDNIRMAEVTPVWVEAVRIAETEGPQRGADHIFAAMPKHDETGALRSWLGTALSKGYHDRVAPFGLQRRDVLEYFPAGAFTSRAESWDELRAIRASEAGDVVAAEAGGLKEWVAKRFGVDFSGAAVATAIAAAAPRMAPPQEFLDLMATLEPPGTSPDV